MFQFCPIRFKNRIDSDTFVNQIAQLLQSGNVNQAVEYCNRTNAALPNITKAGLVEMNKSEKEVQSALEIAAMVEIPKLEKRTHYLSMIANVATLLGLLGTILGLINAFAAVAHADAADKALDICPVGALLKKRVGYAVPVGQRLYDKNPIGSEIESRG